MSVGLTECKLFGVFLQVIFLDHASFCIEVNGSMSESLICWESNNCLALKSKQNICFGEAKILSSTKKKSVENNCVWKATIIKKESLISA